jgi:phospholipase A1/A2
MTMSKAMRTTKSSIKPSTPPTAAPSSNPTSQPTTWRGHIAKALRGRCCNAAVVVAGLAWMLCAPAQAAKEPVLLSSTASTGAQATAATPITQMAPMTAAPAVKTVATKATVETGETADTAQALANGVACLHAGNDAAQLACFTAWAMAQSQLHSQVQLQSQEASSATYTANTARTTAAKTATETTTAANTSAMASAPASAPASAQASAQASTTSETSCKQAPASALQRFWELTPDADCDTFGLRGYKPLSLMWSTANDVNTRPTSPQADHTATTAQSYQRFENLIQLSVRTKVAKGLLVSDDTQKDALWFGYTQKSFWQIFNNELSRPFRATDHEPEIMYIYPTNRELGAGWNWRYAGLSLNHQSNGQTLPLSRSWNRAIVMAGADHANGSRIEAKLWRRLPEAAADDDNPDIQDFVGRGELSGLWALTPKTSLGLTMRHALKAGGKGSVQIDWLQQPSNSTQALGVAAGLRYHVQLFSGYGDSVTDYNHKRTALRVGVSLVDW